MAELLRSVTGLEIPISPEFVQLRDKNVAEAVKYCKACGNMGIRVLQVTVATHVKAEHWNLVSEGFRFSFTLDCPVIYFNNRTGMYFLKNEIKTRFGLKEITDPRPVCYCLGILEEHIRYEILKRSCCDSIQDIVEYTKAGTGKWCLTTNPSGKCCREYLNDIVDKYLNMREATGARPALEKVKQQLTGQVENAKQITMKIQGMTCESCAVSVGVILEKSGAKNVDVSLDKGTAEFTTSSSQPDELVNAVEELGYDAKIEKVERLLPK